MEGFPDYILNMYLLNISPNRLTGQWYNIYLHTNKLDFIYEILYTLHTWSICMAICWIHMDAENYLKAILKPMSTSLSNHISYYWLIKRTYVLFAKYMVHMPDSVSAGQQSDTPVAIAHPSNRLSLRTYSFPQLNATLLSTTPLTVSHHFWRPSIS